MRNLPNRLPIPTATQTQLVHETSEIMALQTMEERKAQADSRYSKERSKEWFTPITGALKSADVRCMYCSSDSPSHVEHYRPRARFPELTFDYENYLLSCSICNNYKGSRFPLDDQGNPLLINPFDDNVWDYFDIDPTFGRLIPKPNLRAKTTCTIIKINSEDIQKIRVHRLNGAKPLNLGLRAEAETAITQYRSGTLNQSQLRDAIQAMIEAPFQTDVADYFLNGSGRTIDPFKTLLELAGETTS